MSNKQKPKFTKGQVVRYIRAGMGCGAEVDKEYIIGDEYDNQTIYQLLDSNTKQPIYAPYCFGSQIEPIVSYKSFKYPPRVLKIRTKRKLKES